MARILVVDDDPDWLELCREKLESMGHDVTTVEDPVAILEEVVKGKPDLVVLDVRMPISGRIMLESVRRHNPRVPVVVHTAYDGYRDDPGFASANAFVVKSVGLERLGEAVDGLLGGEVNAGEAMH